MAMGHGIWRTMALAAAMWCAGAVISRGAEPPRAIVRGTSEVVDGVEWRYSRAPVELS